MINRRNFGYALLIFAFGVSAHDVASIIGLHIHRFHALYWAIPLGVIGYILWKI